MSLVASCDISNQPPTPTNTSRAVCASTGPSTLAAPCEEKYIEIDSPMKAYIGAAVDRYCRLAARTPGSSVKMLTQRSGKIAITVPISADRDERNAARGPGNPPRARDAAGADRHADHRHRGDADRERDRGQHEFEPRADAVAGEDLGAESRQHVGEDA